MLVLTLPVEDTFKELPSESTAVAPASLYVSPNSTVAGLSPFIVITGKDESSSLSESDPSI